MEFRYCRRCGTKLKATSADSFRCENNHIIYRNPVPCVGVFILSEDKKQVTLSVRGIEPRKGMLDAFGGFIDSTDESFERGLERELLEELGLQNSDYTKLRYITSAKGDYPMDGENLTLLGSMYWTTLRPGVYLKPQDDVADVTTIPLHEVDISRLHNNDVRVGIIELQKLFPIVK